MQSKESPVAEDWKILGAGSIGQLLACKLVRAGVPIQLLCRSTQAAQALSRGIELREDNTSRHFPVAATTPGQVQLISALFITTKANQAVTAFQQVRAVLSPTAPVVLLHNGMGVYEQLLQAWPARLLYCGTTTEGAYREGPAQLVHAGLGETRIGQFGGSEAPGWFAAFASSEEAFYWEAAIEHSLWRKLVINCAINPLTAIYRCRNGELIENPAYREQATRVCTELAAVCRARGEDVLAEQVHDLAFEVMRSTAHNQSSMLQDVLHQRPTEIEFISGYLCREARKLGVPCPLNEQLWQHLS